MDGDDKSLLWKLPAIRSTELGKLGPAIGFGAGCGFGFGAGIVGGMGLGPGIPGLQVGFGFGAGCGIGLGFGYGLGRGVAYDDNRSYSNVGKLFNDRGNRPLQDEIDELIGLVDGAAKKLIKTISTEAEKRRRW